MLVYYFVLYLYMTHELFSSVITTVNNTDVTISNGLKNNSSILHSISFFQSFNYHNYSSSQEYKSLKKMRFSRNTEILK